MKIQTFISISTRILSLLENKLDTVQQYKARVLSPLLRDKGSLYLRFVDNHEGINLVRLNIHNYIFHNPIGLYCYKYTEKEKGSFTFASDKQYIQVLGIDSSTLSQHTVRSKSFTDISMEKFESKMRELLPEWNITEQQFNNLVQSYRQLPERNIFYRFWYITAGIALALSGSSYLNKDSEYIYKRVRTKLLADPDIEGIRDNITAALWNKVLRQLDIYVVDDNDPSSKPSIGMTQLQTLIVKPRGVRLLKLIPNKNWHVEDTRPNTHFIEDDI